MKQTGFTRTSFTRYRQGEASGLALSPAWLHVRHVRPDADVVSAAWTARIRIGSAWDVRFGDVLAQSDGRLFCVQQIAPEQATKMLLCSEVRGIIPDDFSSQIFNAWWTKGDLGLWSLVVGESCVKVTPPVASLPSQGAKLYQTVRGDFDVSAKLLCGVGTETNRQFVYLALWYQDKAVTIGRCNDGVPVIARFDEMGGAVVGTELEMIAQYFRLARVGNDLLTYYCELPRGPQSLNDWKLLRASSAAVTCAEDCQVGLGAMAVDAGEENTIYWVKNEWQR